MALSMIRQLGAPTFFLTFTSHERQPEILLACAVAHLCSLDECLDYSRAKMQEEAEEAVEHLLAADRGPWRDHKDAWSLVKRYPAVVQ
eukprot:8197742-Alexandrium_andersonii.AAC.1